MRFIADESCDYAVVTALREAGHDVTAVAETSGAAEDPVVLAIARDEARILVTEDKDFGLLAYAIVRGTAGVVLVRYPGSARSRLGTDVVDVVAKVGERVTGAFIVLEPSARQPSLRSDPLALPLASHPHCVMDACDPASRMISAQAADKACSKEGPS